MACEGHLSVGHIPVGSSTRNDQIQAINFSTVSRDGMLPSHWTPIRSAVSHPAVINSLRPNFSHPLAFDLALFDIVPSFAIDADPRHCVMLRAVPAF